MEKGIKLIKIIISNEISYNLYILCECVIPLLIWQKETGMRRTMSMP